MDDGLVPRRNEVCLQWSKVLILIVVEDGLVQGVRHVQHQVQFVLILVVVDNGLVLVLSLVIGQLWLGLNPCCSGRWSRTNHPEHPGDYLDVLILVVVDNGLVPITIKTIQL